MDVILSSHTLCVDVILSLHTHCVCGCDTVITHTVDVMASLHTHCVCGCDTVITHTVCGCDTVIAHTLCVCGCDTVIAHTLCVCGCDATQGGRAAGKGSGSKSVSRNTRRTASTKPVKPVSRPVRTGQTCPETLIVHIPRDLVGHIRDGDFQDRKHRDSSLQDRTPLGKRPRTEEGRGRGRVSSLSEEDWEERELDEDVFKKV